jgi:hypothetical protein
MTFDIDKSTQDEPWGMSWLSREDKKAYAKQDLEDQARARGFNL